MIIQETVENSDGLEEIIENFVFLSVPSPLNGLLADWTLT